MDGMSHAHTLVNTLRAARCVRPGCGGTYVPEERAPGETVLACHLCGRTRAEAAREAARRREARR